jgi:hypothetical protein
MDEQFKKRLKSFAWRTGMMVVAVTADFVLQNLTSLNLTPLAVTMLGLVLGEVSKYLNEQLSKQA